MNATTPTTPAAPERHYTRPLTFDDLFMISLALGTSIHDMHQDMINDPDLQGSGMAWTHMWEAARSLAAVAEHMCSDHRYEEDRPEGDEKDALAELRARVEAAEHAVGLDNPDILAEMGG